ncbi:MAG: transcriptional regulator, partial [Paenibacillus sp.]|nr:transcriptional regulator [Paenibacillus sp.]
MYLNRTMFLRLVLYSLVIVGLANLIMGSMTYFYFQKTIRDREIQSSRDTLNQSRRMVEMTISEIQKKTTAISENVGVLKVLGHPLGEISYDAIRSVVDHLDNEITSSNYLHSIYLYNERVGKVITNEGIIDYEYFWDRKAIEQMQRYPFYQSWVEPRTISNIGGISMNVMTYALRLPGDGVFNNYIIMNSRMSFFYQPVIDNAAPPNQEFIIYNSEGKVMIYDDRSKRTEALGGLLQELPRDSAKGWFLRDMDGTRLFVSFIRSEYNQWTYMKASSVAETFKESRLILGVVLLITMVCLVIGAVLAFFMSNRYYRPIAHLVQAVAGNRSNPAAKRTDDLSLLHSTFDELITTNRQFEEDLKRHQEVIKEHFLLGLLLGRENDAEDIREKIEYYGLPLPDTPY